MCLSFLTSAPVSSTEACEARAKYKVSRDSPCNELLVIILTILISFDSLKMHVYLVIHEKLPSNGMKVNRPQFNEKIRSVNTEIVDVYSSFDAAKAKAHHHFHESLELECTDDECDEGCFYWSAVDGEGDNTMFDESVLVKRVKCK